MLAATDGSPQLPALADRVLRLTEQRESGRVDVILPLAAAEIRAAIHAHFDLQPR